MLAPRKKLWSTPDAAFHMIAELLELSEEDTVIDIGCGTANVLRGDCHIIRGLECILAPNIALECHNTCLV